MTESALLREVPTSVAAARLASRYLSASAEARVGGDVVEVIADGKRIVERGGNWLTRSFGAGYPDLENVVEQLKKHRGSV